MVGKLVKLTLSTHNVPTNIGDLKTEELRFTYTLGCSVVFICE